MLWSQLKQVKGTESDSDILDRWVREASQLQRVASEGEVNEMQDKNPRQKGVGRGEQMERGMRAAFQAGGWHVKGQWGARVAGAPWETGRARDGDREVPGALWYRAKSQDFILFVEKPLQVI